jgi:hypothetical protein
VADRTVKPRIFKRNGWWYADYLSKNFTLGLTQRVLIAQADSFIGICRYVKEWQWAWRGVLRG